MRKVIIAIVPLLISIGFAACSPADNGGFQKEKPAKEDSTKATSYTNIKPQDAKSKLVYKHRLLRFALFHCVPVCVEHPRCNNHQMIYLYNRHK